MNPDAVTIDQKRELLRRRAQMGASSAGIGAETTNSPLSPIPAEMQTSPQMPSGGAAGSPSDGTISAAKKQKGEAQKLTDAMIYRMKKLTERGE